MPTTAFLSAPASNRILHICTPSRCTFKHAMSQFCTSYEESSGDLWSLLTAYLQPGKPVMNQTVGMRGGWSPPWHRRVMLLAVRLEQLTRSRGRLPSCNIPSSLSLICFWCDCAQVVGLRGGWHTGLAMAGMFSRLHAKRLAQAAEVVIELRANSALPIRRPVIYGAVQVITIVRQSQKGCLNALARCSRTCAASAVQVSMRVAHRYASFVHMVV